MLDELLVPSSNRGTWPRTEIWADFSPLSDEISELQLVRSLEDNHLLVWVSTSQDVTHEREGTRERNRMERECAEQRRKRGRESLSLPDTPQDDELDPAAYDAWYEKYFALERTPSIWPQNRACFLNIVDHLKQALPVRKVELDPRLLDP